MRAGATLSAALADNDPTVRKAALERVAAQKDKLEAGERLTFEDGVRLFDRQPPRNP